MYFCLYKYANFSCKGISTFEPFVNCLLSICYVNFFTCIPRSYSAMSFWIQIRKTASLRTKLINSFIKSNVFICIFPWFVSWQQKTKITPPFSPWNSPWGCPSTWAIKNYLHEVLLSVFDPLRFLITSLRVNKFSFHKETANRENIS